MSGIRADALASEIARLMEEYSSEVAQDVKTEAKAVAKEAVKELKQAQIIGAGSKKGHYKDGWTSKVERESAASIGIRIYNRKKPGLTHLLEKGHEKRGGGRVEGKKHIEPAEQAAVESYERRLRERLSR